MSDAAEKPLAGRVALVTGASRGLGAATALALAGAGAHVVALARTVGALEELDDRIRAVGGTATLVPLDLRKDHDNIDKVGFALYERHGKLDIFVGNAAVLGPLSPLGHVEPKAWDEVFAVNVTANWRFVRVLDPLLRRSEAGRAVFITSGAGRKAPAYWGPYAASKAALDTIARTWAAETASLTNLKVNLFSPGPVRTKMRETAMPGEDPMTLPAPETVAAAILPLCLSACTTTGGTWEFAEKRFL